MMQAATVFGSSSLFSIPYLYVSSSKFRFIFNAHFNSSSSSLTAKCRMLNCLSRNRLLFSCTRTSIHPSSALAAGQFLEKPSDLQYSSRDMHPKIDKSGRFCSPRAARELALLIIYAACLEGSDPVRLFEKRMNARREPGYGFNKGALMEYNHMSFGGPPVTAETAEEADELMHNDQKQSEIEAEVLSAPPKLVYSKFILRFTRKLLVAVVEMWDSNVLVIDGVVPHNWKNEPAGKILELSILHLAMAEIAVLGTRHQIVINEAVDLAKRYCDGAAPRIINGCLRTFGKDCKGANAARGLKDMLTVFR